MKKQIVVIKNTNIAEVIDPGVIISSEQDALDLMGNTNEEYIIISDFNLKPEFFDLSTKLAGVILQKFTNYRVKLAIVGDFTKYPSQTLKDFIYESNKFGNYLFVSSKQEALDIWEKHLPN